MLIPSLDRCERGWALGWGCIWTPLIMLFPLWLGLFSEPRLILEYAQTYALLFGVPIATGVAILVWEHRRSSR